MQQPGYGAPPPPGADQFGGQPMGPPHLPPGNINILSVITWSCDKMLFLFVYQEIEEQNEKFVD